MGIVRTRYEDEANNNIKFDQSKFDFTYTSDTFPTDIQTDVSDILSEIGDLFKIIKVEESDETTDTMGNVSAIDESDYFYAIASVQPITQKDRQIHDMGLAAPGRQKVFFAHQYTTTSAGVDTNNEVKTGYIMEDRNDKRWRLVELSGDWYFSNKLAYKLFVIQSIELNEQ